MNFKYWEFKNNPAPYFENMKIFLNKYHNEYDDLIFDEEQNKIKMRYFNDLLFHFISEFFLDKDNLISNDIYDTTFTVVTVNYNEDTFKIYIKLIEFIRNKLFDVKGSYINFYLKIWEQYNLLKLKFLFNYNSERIADKHSVDYYIEFLNSTIAYFEELLYKGDFRKNPLKKFTRAAYKKSIKRAKTFLIEANKLKDTS